MHKVAYSKVPKFDVAAAFAAVAVGAATLAGFTLAMGGAVVLDDLTTTVVNLVAIVVLAGLNALELGLWWGRRRPR